MLKRKEKLTEEMLLNKRIRNPGLELIGLRTTGRRLICFFFLLETYYLFLRWGAIGLKDCSIKRES